MDTAGASRFPAITGGGSCSAELGRPGGRRVSRIPVPAYAETADVEIPCADQRVLPRSEELKVQIETAASPNGLLVRLSVRGFWEAFEVAFVSPAVYASVSAEAAGVPVAGTDRFVGAF